jgi:hypothetical protein
MVGALWGWHCEIGHHVSRVHTQGWPCESLVLGTMCSGIVCGGGRIAKPAIQNIKKEQYIL